MTKVTISPSSQTAETDSHRAEISATGIQLVMAQENYRVASRAYHDAMRNIDMYKDYLNKISKIYLEASLHSFSLSLKNIELEKEIKELKKYNRFEIMDIS